MDNIHMDTIVKLLVIWFLVSILASLLIGRYLSVANKGQPRPKPATNHRSFIPVRRQSPHVASTVIVKTQPPEPNLENNR